MMNLYYFVDWIQRIISPVKSHLILIYEHLHVISYFNCYCFGILVTNHYSFINSIASDSDFVDYNLTFTFTSIDVDTIIIIIALPTFIISMVDVNAIID